MSLTRVYKFETELIQPNSEVEKAIIEVTVNRQGSGLYDISQLSAWSGKSRRAVRRKVKSLIKRGLARQIK